MKTNGQSGVLALALLLINLSKFLAAILLVFGALYVAGFGVFNDTYIRVGAFTLAALVILCIGFSQENRAPWAVIIDIFLLIFLVLAVYRYFWLSEELESGLYELTNTDIWVGIGGLIVLLELSRRIVGTPLVLVCSLAVGYAALGSGLPWIFGHAGVDVGELLLTLWYSFDGVYGRPMAVVSTTILVFIVFGSVLESVGIGRVILKLSVMLAGGLRGGAAHAAVFASGLFGTVSGSAVANVVGTGVITIPMIKKAGFSARFAGAVEAAASSGGQLMPPVMGAVAFIMADLTGIPYIKICLAALLPALFYYGGLFTFIAIEAKSRNIARIPVEERPKLTRKEWLMTLGFVLPLVLIVVMLVKGYSPALAGFWSVIVALVFGVAFNPSIIFDKKRLAGIVSASAKACSAIIIAVAAVGMIIAVMNLTGLGLRFAGAIQTIGEGSLFLSLIVMMLGCLVLGMGMPTVPAYLIIVLVMGTAVESLGVETIAAHLFVVYFAALSAVTPPVALAAFAAAPIANASPIGIGVTCMRIAFIGFVIPFVFVYEPSLLLITDMDPVGFLWAVVRLVSAVVVLAVGFGHAGWVGNSTLLISLGLLMPSLPIQLASFVLASVFLIQKYGFKSKLKLNYKNITK